MKLSLCLPLIWLLSANAWAADKPAHAVLHRFVLGGEGGWDYLTIDEPGHRIFLSRATHVAVIDSETGKPVGDIANTPGVHGIALAPEFGRGFVSNGRAGTVSIFDLKTLQSIGEVKAGTNPDAILFDPASRRVWAFNGRSQDATVIDAAKGTVVATVALGGKPEFAVSDEKGKIFVNIEDKSEIVAIDAQAMTVLARHPLAPCQEPTGLAIDVQHARLFAACSNKIMAVVNAETGKVVTTLAIGQGTDGAAFDAGTQTVYSSNGEGTLTIVHQESPDKYKVVQNLATAHGARTMALDRQTHKAYVVTAKFGPPPAATAEQPHPRPSILPGTFEVIVVGKP